MNFPNAVHSQHSHEHRIDSIDFDFPSTHLAMNGRNSIESASSVAAAGASGITNLHTAREENNLCYFGYDKYFDSNTTEYHKNSFDTNTIANQQCIQSIAYNTNYGEINHAATIETGRLFDCYYLKKKRRKFSYSFTMFSFA